jgi:hypothetical protein
MTESTTAAPDSGATGQTPAMPVVAASELFRGAPRLLRNSGVRHSIGWQDHRSAGPGFVVARLSQLDIIKVVARFPLTPDGWVSAWQALLELDPDAAASIAERLVARTEREIAAELDSNSVRLRWMTYDVGSGGAPLIRGQSYDLRFLDDRLEIFPAGPGGAVAELPYRTVEAVDIEGSARGRPSSETIAIVSAGALGGAVIGFVVLGALGLFLGALLVGLIAAAAIASADGSKTILRLRGPDSEFFFSKASASADALRIELSRPLLAIDRARGNGSPAGPPAPPAPSGPARTALPAEGTTADQLTKLAALLADGLLSREEFDQLKARVIAQP